VNIDFKVSLLHLTEASLVATALDASATGVSLQQQLVMQGLTGLTNLTLSKAASINAPPPPSPPPSPPLALSPPLLPPPPPHVVVDIAHESVRPVVHFKTDKDDPEAGIAYGRAPAASKLPAVDIPKGGIPWPTAAAPIGFIKSRVFLEQTGFEEWWKEGQFINAQPGPYFATDKNATSSALGYLQQSAITVTGWTDQDAHGGGRINRAVEKSGEFPYRIFYDAVDPSGNVALQAIREIYVYNPCIVAVNVYPPGSGYICAALSVRGSEPVCATCTAGVCDPADALKTPPCDPCVCIDMQMSQRKPVIIAYVPKKDFISPTIWMSPGSPANGFAVDSIHATDSSGAGFIYEVGTRHQG